MKKNRNSFFAESSYQSYNPNMNNMNMGGAPYQTASNYFYQGPVPNNNYNTGNQLGGSTIDIESRFAKIERQLNRLDYRLSKLENNNNVVTSEDFDINNSNMYML